MVGRVTLNVITGALALVAQSLDLDHGLAGRLQGASRIVVVRNIRAVAGARGVRFALLVSVVALFGILSMHGWGIHASPHAGTHAGPQVQDLDRLDDPMLQDGSGVFPASARVNHERAAHGGHATTGDLAVCEADCGSGHGSWGMAGMCLAVIGALLLGLGLLFLGRAVPRPPSLAHATRYLVAISRERDPPDLFVLSVIRC